MSILSLMSEDRMVDGKMAQTITKDDPSRDVRYEISCKSGVIESVDKVFFSKLVSGVIDADRCVQCASCILACPSRSIGIAVDDHPTLVRMCTGCSLCWDFCPRGGLRSERLWASNEDQSSIHDPTLGEIRGAFTARAVPPIRGAQDGGVVTAILRKLFEHGEIDGAIVARRDSRNSLKGEAYVAKRPEDLDECSGSFYNQTLPLGLLKNIISGGGLSGLNGNSRLAFVGTPCEIAGVKAVQMFPWKYRFDGGLRLVKYTVGLMCTRNFDLNKLMREFKARGFDLSRAKKMDVKENILRLYDEHGDVMGEEHVRAFRNAALRGCAECADFSSRMADISVGAVGSESGYSSVLVRTENGETAWRLCRDVLSYRPIDDLEEIRRVEKRNTDRAVRSMRRSFDLKLPIKIPYSEHLSSYAGSDRDLAKPASHRIHHYENTC